MKKITSYIFFNGRFLGQPTTGVQRYASELLNALDDVLGIDKAKSQEFKFICLIPEATSEKNLPGWKNICINQCGRLGGNLWEQIELPYCARKGLLVNLCNIGPLFHTNQIVVFHDASVFAIPEIYSLAFRAKYRFILWVLARTARQIITDSEFSRNELAHHLHIDKKKIDHIPAGGEHILKHMPDFSILKDSRFSNHPFLLAVGSSSLHKNLTRLEEAIRNCDDSSLTLVVAGGSFSKVFKTVKEVEALRTIRLGFVTDPELRALYSRAIGFVFPSLYEGFGIPPLEAMACGCPVICSNKASLPEVCGDAALYFDPMNIQEIRVHINRLIADPALQVALKERGFQQVNRFSWEEAAQRYWKVIQDCLQSE